MTPTYQALRSTASIRLLELWPGFRQDRIFCDLRVFSIDYAAPTDHCDHYEAVSYAWGEGDRSKRIWLNGKPFRVSSNLWTLLCSVRRIDRPRMLWVDALCINQADVLERNHQLELMGQIYRGADRVLCWLGEAHSMSDLALEFLIGLYLLVAFDSEDSRKARFGFSPTLELRAFPDHLQLHWQALKTLCERPYWQRTWIVQEILLASEVEILCGSNSIPWYCFDRMIDCLRGQPLTIGSCQWYIMKSRAAQLCIQRRNPAERKLSNLLTEHYNALCTDRKDKVYGLLGIANDYTPGEGFVPDYSSGAVEIYLDTMRLCEIPRLESHNLSWTLQRALAITERDVDAFFGACCTSKRKERSCWNFYFIFSRPLHAAQDMQASSTIMDSDSSVPGSFSSYDYSRARVAQKGYIVDALDEISMNDEDLEQLRRRITSSCEPNSIYLTAFRPNENVVQGLSPLSPTDLWIRNLRQRVTVDIGGTTATWVTTVAATPGDLIYLFPNSDIGLVVRRARGYLAIVGPATEVGEVCEDSDPDLVDYELTMNSRKPLRFKHLLRLSTFANNLPPSYTHVDFGGSEVAIFLLALDDALNTIDDVISRHKWFDQLLALPTSALFFCSGRVHQASFRFGEWVDQFFALLKSVMSSCSGRLHQVSSRPAASPDHEPSRAPPRWPFSPPAELQLQLERSPV